MDSLTPTSPASPGRHAPAADVILSALAQAALLAASGHWLGAPAAFYLLGAALFAGLWLLLGRALVNAGRRDPGPANRVTLGRGLLVILLASAAPFPDMLQQVLWPYALLCLGALLLDGVDGHVARRTGSASELGARFDMELDAFFILILCLAVISLDRTGPWVLLLGLMRYGFVIAAWLWPPLRQPLPPSRRRKTVCVWQIVTLLVAVLPPVAPWFAQLTLGIALILLSYSFAVDIRHLYLAQNPHRRSP